MEYKHTQIGILMIVVLGLVIGTFISIVMQEGVPTQAMIIMVLVIVLLSSFLSLTVTIREGMLKLKFGYGLYGKSFRVKDIVFAKAVKNTWYYGWGIRYWFWPHMRIYNVSGFDAVEIKLKDGRIHRIGTDEPKALEFAIKQHIKQK